MKKLSIIIVFAFTALLIGCEKKETVQPSSDDSITTPTTDSSWVDYQVNLFEDLRYETESWHAKSFDILLDIENNGWESDPEGYKKESSLTYYGYTKMSGQEKLSVVCYYDPDAKDELVLRMMFSYKKDYFKCLSKAKVYHDVADKLTNVFWLYNYMYFHFQYYTVYNDEEGDYFYGKDYSIVVNYFDDLVLNNEFWNIVWEAESKNCICVMGLKDGWVYISFGY